MGYGAVGETGGVGGASSTDDGSLPRDASAYKDLIRNDIENRGFEFDPPSSKYPDPTLHLHTAAEVETLFRAPSVLQDPARFVREIVIADSKLDFACHTLEAQAAMAKKIGQLPLSQSDREALFQQFVKGLGPKDLPAQKALAKAFAGDGASAPPPQLSKEDPVRQKYADAAASAAATVSKASAGIAYTPTDLLALRRDLEAMAQSIVKNVSPIIGSTELAALQGDINEFAMAAERGEAKLPPGADWKTTVGPAIKQIIDATKAPWTLTVERQIGGTQYTFTGSPRDGASPVKSVEGLNVSETGLR